MRSSLVIVGCLVAFFGCEEEAGTEARGTTVALFLTSKSEADARAAAAILEDLETLAGRTPDVTVVSGAALHDRIDADPGDAITTCGADLACIAELGARAKVDEVVFGRLAKAEDGIRAQFLSIKTGEEHLNRRVQLKIASLQDAADVLADRFADILGVPLPPEPDAPAEPEADERTPVAQCGLTVGAVRIRPAATLAWEPLQAGRKLYAGDVIETGDVAMARVDYTSGKQLEIAPASTIVIEAGRGSEKTEQIAIRAGTVRGVVDEGQGEITVRAPDGERVALAPEVGSGKLSYRVGVRDNSAIEVAVREGRGVVKGAGGQTATLAAGLARDVERGKLSETIELPDFPGLINPGVDATVSYKHEMNLSMKWKPIAGAVAYHVQVAEDQSFRHLRVDELSGATRWIFSPPSAGTYYWRVATQAKGGREGEFGFARRVYVTPTKKLDLLVAPADGAELKFEANTPRFISFTWRAAVPPAPYVLLVSEYEDVRHKPAVRITTKAQEVMTRQIPPGYYYWGVFVQRGRLYEPLFKEPRKLTVIQPE